MVLTSIRLALSQSHESKGEAIGQENDGGVNLETENGDRIEGAIAEASLDFGDY